MGRSICPKCEEQTFWDGFGDCDFCGYSENDDDGDDGGD